MLPWFNEALKPNLQKMLRPGARIVAHDFGIGGWRPDKTKKLPEIEQRPDGYRHQHTIYLWRIGKSPNPSQTANKYFLVGLPIGLGSSRHNRLNASIYIL
jgi:hypothetical protein